MIRYDMKLTIPIALFQWTTCSADSEHTPYTFSTLFNNHGRIEKTCRYISCRVHHHGFPPQSDHPVGLSAANYSGAISGRGVPCCCFHGGELLHYFACWFVTVITFFGRRLYGTGLRPSQMRLNCFAGEGWIHQ